VTLNREGEIRGKKSLKKTGLEGPILIGISGRVENSGREKRSFKMKENLVEFYDEKKIFLGSMEIQAHKVR